jgi:hypothetical protein
MKTSKLIILVVIALVVIWVSFRVWMTFDGVHDLANDKESVFLEKVNSRTLVSDATNVSVVSDGNIYAKLSNDKLTLSISGFKDYAEVATQYIDSTMIVTISKADTFDIRRFYLEYQVISLKRIGLKTKLQGCTANLNLELHVDQHSQEELTIDATYITHLTIESSHYTELHIVSDSSNCPITIYLTDSSSIENLYVDISRPGKLVLETYAKISNSIKTSDSMKQILPIPEQND